MFKNKSVGVVVPAYNEEKLIGKVLSTMPDFVDSIIVVNDGSKDKTKSIIEGFAKRDKRITLINHSRNQGLGKSLIDGYLKSLELKIDVTVVMAGDAQMDPTDLPALIDPIVGGRTDYAKGNRLLVDKEVQQMPVYRFLGNSVLTLLTKFATGYWHIIDPQCGYTAVSYRALKRIPIEGMTRGYGYNAHLLNMLNLKNCTVKDCEVKPVYGEEKSKIRLGSYIPKVSWLLLGLFFKRMFRKYLVREFHPLIFFYLFAFVNIVVISIPLTARFLYIFIRNGAAPTTTLMILTFSFMMGFFSFFFGMWMDMEDNKKLIGR